MCLTAFVGIVRYPRNALYIDVNLGLNEEQLPIYQLVTDTMTDLVKIEHVVTDDTCCAPFVGPAWCISFCK